DKRSAQLSRRVLGDADSRDLGLDDVGFEASEEVEDFVLLARRHLKMHEHGTSVLHKELPLGLGNAQASVAGLHVAATVKRWATGGGNEKVDDQLAIFPKAVLAFALPVVLEQRVVE